jgi:hypothetical protein
MGRGITPEPIGSKIISCIYETDGPYSDEYHSSWSPSSSNSLPESINGLVDPKLGSIFGDLQQVASRINSHWSQNELLQSSAFQPFQDSIQSRLLTLKDSLGDTTSECLRLGLLAFLVVTTFRVPDNRSIRANKARPYPYLTNGLREACFTIEPSTPRLSSLVFWLLTVGAMSVFDLEDEDWLVLKWTEVSKSLPGVRLGWEDARIHLESLLWVRRVHDDLGRETYLKLMNKG